MLTGSVPYSAETPMAVALQHVHEPLPLPSARHAGVPAASEHALLEALSKNPGDRFPSCGAFVAALAPAAGSHDVGDGPAMYAMPRRTPGPIGAGATLPPVQSGTGAVPAVPPPATPATAPAARRSRRGMLVAAVAVVAVLGAVIAVFALRSKGGGTQEAPAATEQALAAEPSASSEGANAAAGASPSGFTIRPIYNGRLAAGWSNDTDPKQASVRLSSLPQHAGHAAIQVDTLAPYAGLRLASSGVDTGGFTHLRFFVRQDQPGASLDGVVSGTIDGQDRDGSALSSAAVLRSDEANGWTRLDVPLAWIGLNDGQLTSLSFDTNTDKTGIRFAVADIALVHLTPPAPDPAQAGGLRFTAAFGDTPVPGVVVLLSNGARLTTDSGGHAVFDGVARGKVDYRVTFPDSFQGSPLVESDEGQVTVKAGTTVEQPLAVVKSDLQVDAPKNEASVTQPVSLRWQAYPGAARYHVDIDPHDSGDSVERDTAQPSLTLDTTLPPNAVYQYRVTALNAAGQLIARSDSESFRTP
jgi:hypothetical protein